MKDYLYVLGTVLFTVYGQIILKWRLNFFGAMPAGGADKLKFLFKAFLDPYILSGFFAAFLAALCWMVAMTRLELTKAYPFTTLAPAIVFLIGTLFMGETFTWGKVIGLVFIVAGVIVTVKF